MKSFLTVVLIIEFVATFSLMSTVCTLRPGMVQAISAYGNAPTPVNKAELEKQSQISQLTNLVFSLVIFAFLAIPTFFIFRNPTWKRLFAEGNKN